MNEQFVRLRPSDVDFVLDMQDVVAEVRAQSLVNVAELRRERVLVPDYAVDMRRINEPAESAVPLP